MLTRLVALSSLLFLSVADAAQRVEFIIDGSGSMWGQVGEETKIATAKRVLRDLIQRIDLSPESSIGLTAYGHRQKGDCSDIEHMGTMGYSKRSDLLPIIEGLSPKGKTPIADSLLSVGDGLKTHEGPVSIVLVSDGIESCRKDPCAVAQQLRDQYGIDVTIHVVGFDVQESQEQLQCVARAGGGGYFSADDAGELASAFEEVKAELIKADVASVPSPKSAEPEGEPVNLAAADNGGTIVLYSSQYNTGAWAAANLNDGGTDRGWSSNSANPQSVVIGFNEGVAARIVDVVINPYTNESSDRWPKEVEIQTSSSSPYFNYQTVATLDVKPTPEDQFITFEPPIEARYVRLNFLTNHGGSYVQAGEVMVMGWLLPDSGDSMSPQTSLAAAENGASIAKFSSQYNEGGWAAANLIDGGTDHGWSSKTANPQEVIVQLPEHRGVHAVAINPYSNESYDRWAKEVEILTSARYSYKGFESHGIIELTPKPVYQELEFASPVEAKYVKFKFLSNHGGSYMQAGELLVLGK